MKARGLKARKLKARGFKAEGVRIQKTGVRIQKEKAKGGEYPRPLLLGEA